MEEKKVTKKFYYLSAVNILPAIIMGWGNPMDVAVLIVVLFALMMNHIFLVKIIGELTRSMTSDGQSSSSSLKKILGFMLAKMMLLGIVMVLTYLYNPALVPKVMLLMIFQLIIQVVSIKNNY